MDRNEFMKRWRAALKSYGTPEDFADGVQYTSFSMFDHPFMRFTSTNHQLRRDLMDRQRPYEPQQESYQVDLIVDQEAGKKACFLCENVAQAFDHGQSDDLLNNVIFDWGDYFVLPNRYPPFSGSCLFLPKWHDNMTLRTATLAPKEGKTRANILTASFLEATIDICDRLMMVGLRNHPLDGMSIRDHDHFQTFTCELEAFGYVGYVLSGRTPTAYGKSVFTSANTPFDTLIVSSKNRQDIVDIACPLLEQMERGNGVYTLLYVPGLDTGHLMIGSRFASQIGNERLKEGMAGLPGHYVASRDEKYIEEIKRVVPFKGAYGWDRFF